MPFAVDRLEKMWTAANLNNLYSRFDQKCARVLDDKSPLFAGSKDGPWVGQYPFGVWYVFRNDPDAARRLVDTGNGIPGIGTDYRDEHSEVAAGIELSKLENKHLDVVGGQVYVDRFVAAGDPFTCDVAAIHYSWRLWRREIAGIQYDVHLGYDPTNAGLSSYIRGSLGPIDPTLPPGRIHKHRLAVAEIAIEGLSSFSILNTYQRFDCWRVHNCGANVLRVNLQLPDGSSERHFVPKGGCRSFRRKPDGTWANTWPGGGVCTYFFPTFTGDVPFYAGGPPDWSANSAQSPFLAIERSAQANNVANPFVLMEWRRVMGAIHDPFASYDIRQIYQRSYADPGAFATAVGDCVFTWGRARVTYENAAGDIFDDRVVRFNGTSTLEQGLRSLGMTVTVNPTDLTLTSNRGVIRIYPIDANIFTREGVPYWEIGSTAVVISTIYPQTFVRSSSVNFYESKSWTAGNEVTIFDQMIDLRRKVAVEEGFINNYDDVHDIVEEKVSVVTTTPMGLVVRATSSTGIDGDLLINFEANADNESLYIADRPIGWGAGPWATSRYTARTRIYYLHRQRSTTAPQWSGLFPSMSLAVSSGFWSAQAVNTAFIPPGGPWGFSSSVWDTERARAYGFAVGSSDPRGWGADFWQNKWGGANGIDASVRIPGSPNRTRQLDLADINNVGTRPTDDIFRDELGANYAATLPLPVTSPANYQEGLTDLRWTYGSESGFDVPYYPGANSGDTTGGGPFFHKIPKSTWLWNLLEWSVRSWTRAIPLCHGQNVCPVRDASGGAAVLDVLTAGMLTLGTTGYEAGLDMRVYYVSEAQADIWIANGVIAYRQTDPGGNDYWFIPAVELSTYCLRMGFSSYNWDTQNGRPTENPPVDPTRYDAVRNYGPGERVQAASYLDVTTGNYVYLFLRYVDLRLPNE